MEEPVEDQTQPTITLEVKQRYNLNFFSNIHQFYHRRSCRHSCPHHHIMIIVSAQVVIIDIIVQVVMVVTRFLASPTQLAASPRSWRCKHPWQPPALPPCQPPC